MVDKNLKQEACQLYIEQQIDEGIVEGKTSYKIGKEIKQEIDTLFKTKINLGTVTKRAQRRKKLGTNVPSSDEGKTRDKLGTNNVSRDKLGTTRDKSKLKKILEQISIKELQDVVSKATVISKEIGAGQTAAEILGLGLNMYSK